MVVGGGGDGVCVGWGSGLINSRKGTSYDIRLSIYNDAVRPVEMKRC